MSVRDPPRFSHSPEGPRGSPRRPSPRRARARAVREPRPEWDEARRVPPRLAPAEGTRPTARRPDERSALAFASLGRTNPRDARERGRRRVGTEAAAGRPASVRPRVHRRPVSSAARPPRGPAPPQPGLGWSMGTVSPAFFARAALNASSFARPFAAAADLPPWRPRRDAATAGAQSRRARTHARHPVPGEGPSWVRMTRCRGKRFRGFRLMMRSIVILKMTFTQLLRYLKSPRRSLPRERRRERPELPAGLLVSVAVFPHMPALSPAAPRVPAVAPREVLVQPRRARRVEARALALRQQLMPARTRSARPPPRDRGPAGRAPTPSYQRPRRTCAECETPGTPAAVPETAPRRLDS